MNSDDLKKLVEVTMPYGKYKVIAWLYFRSSGKETAVVYATGLHGLIIWMGLVLGLI